MKKYLHTIPLGKIVTHRFKIDEAEDAIKTSINREDAIKVVIAPSEKALVSKL